MFKKIGLGLFCVAVQVQANTALQQLHLLLDPIHTLKADFLQTTQSEQGQPISEAKGCMQIKRPGQFYWRTTVPGKQTIIINGKQLWLYDEDLQQVTQRKLSAQSPSLSPASLLSGDLNSLVKNNEISLRADDGRQVVFIKPKAKNSATKWIELVYHNKRLLGLRFSNQLQQITRIDFVNPQLNGTISTASFEFKPPEGADLLS